MDLDTHAVLYGSFIYNTVDTLWRLLSLFHLELKQGCNISGFQWSIFYVFREIKFVSIDIDISEAVHDV